MKGPIVFFDLGQTLIDERDFIDTFDARFLELLNGFGARIDMRNYRALRDNVIKDRRIGYGSARELAYEVCRLILQPGYDRLVMPRIDQEISQGRRSLYCLYDGTTKALESLSQHCELGIIANQQAQDVAAIFEKEGLDRFFRVKVISSDVGLKKPDRRIFELAMGQASRQPSECIMVGDRLDTDICPANQIGMMATIRTTDSLFSLQEPRSECERPTYTVPDISRVPEVVEKVISRAR